MTFPFNFEFDSESGTALHHLSFFLKYYIPTERFDEIQGIHELDIKMNRIRDTLRKGRVPSGKKFTFTGSAAEGLSLPQMKDRIGFEEFGASDIDVMIVMPRKVAEPEAQYSRSEEEKRDYLMFKPTHHVGFFNVFSNETGKKLDFASFEPFQEWDTAIRVKESRGRYVFPMAHGPAFTQEVKVDDFILTEVDYVYCLKLQKWPLQATSWLTRQRPNGWPSDALIHQIVSKDVYIVPVGYPFCHKAFYEWRISFSQAEKILAKSLTIHQKKVYIILKLLHKVFLSHPSILATYHLKTVLFWTIEKTLPSMWCEDRLAYCLLALLDQLHAFLKQGSIPNYFIPEYNVIATADEMFVETLKEKVLALRQNPLECLLELDRKCEISFTPSKESSWLEILNVELKEALAAKEMVKGIWQTLPTAEEKMQRRVKEEKNALEMYQGIVEKLVIIGLDDKKDTPPFSYILSLLKDAYDYFTVQKATHENHGISFMKYLQALFESASESMRKSEFSYLFIDNEFCNISHFLYTFGTESYHSVAKQHSTPLGLIFHRTGILKMLVAQYDPSKFDNQPSHLKRNVDKEKLLKEAELCFKTAREHLEDDLHLVLSYVTLLWIKSEYQALINLCVSCRKLFQLDTIILTLYEVDVIIHEDSLQKLIFSESNRCDTRKLVRRANIDGSIVFCFYFSLAHLKLNKYLNPLFVESFTTR